MTLLDHLEKILKEFIDIEEAKDLWATLAYPDNKGKLFILGLKNAVALANDPKLQLDINKKLSLFQQYLSKEIDFYERIKSFYKFKNWPVEEKDLKRLFNNTKALISTAYLAILAKMPTSSPSSLFIEQAVVACKSLSVKNNSINLEKSIPNIILTELSPLAILTKVFENLAKKGYEVKGAYFWTLWWLNQETEIFSNITRKVKIFGYTNSSAELSYVNLQLLKNLPNLGSTPALVESLESSLLPIDSLFLEGIERAWEIAGKPTAFWGLETTKTQVTPKIGDSHSAATMAGFASLTSSVHYDPERIILAIVQKDSPKLTPVGEEYFKLEAALAAKAKLAALVEFTTSTNLNNNRIANTNIDELRKKGLEIRFISTIQQAIDFVTIKKPDQFNLPSKPPHFLRRDDQIKKLKSLIFSNKNRIIVIEGMGGSGKTELAAEYARSEDPDIWKIHSDGIFWIQLGEDTEDEVIIARQVDLIRCLTGEEKIIKDIEQGKTLLKEILIDKACLLILNDVWSKKQFQGFDVLDNKSYTLITSREGDLTTAIGGESYLIEPMIEDDIGWKLMLSWAGNKSPQSQSEEEIIARKIAKDWCEYLPLGLALCGAQVRDLLSWKALNEALNTANIGALEHKYGNIEAIIVSSLKILPETELQRYQELAVYKHNIAVAEKSIEMFWYYTSNLQEKPLSREQINNLIEKLASKALVKVTVGGATRYIELHDLIYVYLRNITGMENYEIDTLINKLSSKISLSIVPNSKNSEKYSNLNTFLQNYLHDVTKSTIQLHNKLLAAYQTQCLPEQGWPSGPNDGYFFQQLAYHLISAHKKTELRTLLLNFEWLQTKLEQSDLTSLLSDFQYIDDPDTELVKIILRKSSHVLNKDKNQLAGRLIGNLIDNSSPDIGVLINKINQWKGSVWLRPTTECFSDPPKGPLIKILTGHKSQVNAVAITLDSKIAVSSSDDGTIIVWDIPTGKISHILSGHTSLVDALTITPDGQFVISGSNDGTIKVWVLKNGEMIKSLSDQKEIKAVVAWRDNKTNTKFISSSFLGDHRVWDMETYQTLYIQKPSFKQIIVTYNYHYAVSFNEYAKPLYYWEIEDSPQLRKLEGHKEWVSAIAVDKDNTHVISGSCIGEIIIWDLSIGAILKMYSGNGQNIDAIAIWNTAQYGLVAFKDEKRRGLIKIVDFSRDTELCRFIAHAATIKAITISPDEKYAVSTSLDCTVKIWSLEVLVSENIHLILPSIELFESDVDRGSIQLLKQLQKNKSDENYKKLREKYWDMKRTWIRDVMLGKHTQAVLSLAITPDGKYVASTSYDDTLKLWNIKKHHVLRTFIGKDNFKYNTFIFLTEDSKEAFVWGKNYAKRYILAFSIIQVILKALDRYYESTVSLLFDYIKSSFFNVSHHLRGVVSTVNSIVVTNDNKHLILATTENTLLLWSLKKKKIIRLIRKDSIDLLAIMPDSSHVVLASQSKLKLCNWQTGNITKEVSILDLSLLHSADETADEINKVVAMAVSPNGKYIAILFRDRSIKTWDLNSNTIKDVGIIDCSHPFYRHTVYLKPLVHTIAILADNKHMIVTSEELSIWDIEEGKQVGSFNGDSKIYASTVALDRRTIVVGDELGNIYTLLFEGSF